MVIILVIDLSVKLEYKLPKVFFKKKKLHV